MLRSTIDLRIDGERLRRHFDALARIGASPGGGVHRPALGEAHLAARRWFRERAVADGLAFDFDAAGNGSARLPGAPPAARTLLLGSHLDSVPDGGRFDGALGTLVAYEVLCTVRDAGLALPVHLEAIDFTDEEGTLVGLLGSRALAGTLDPAELAHPRGGRKRLVAGLERAGLDEDRILDARRDPASLAGFLELHIEQGPRLLDADLDIGIVSAIVGFCSCELTFSGSADHAGTTPMDTRRDAGLAAASFVVAANALVRREFPTCVANVGKLVLEPGAANVVPGRAVAEIEFRSTDPDLLDHMERDLVQLARQTAGDANVELAAERLVRIEPSPCAALVRRAFAAACDGLGLRHTELPSGAGHDTMALAAVCPAGMIFVPSSGGSHSAREHAEWDACVAGANVMLHAALDLAFARARSE